MHSDSPQYFNFADKATLLGIPHFGDVVSNLAFLIVGFYGLWALTRQKDLSPNLRLFKATLAVGSILTAFGSAYFHWNPTPATLFWDRLPMTVIFSSIISLLVTDRIGKTAGRITALAVFPAGGLSVMGWYLQWFSLLPYILFQYGGIVFIFVLATQNPKGAIKNKTVAFALGLYMIAKIFEVFDWQVFNLTHFMSGHTLKHLLAAAALLKLLK